MALADPPTPSMHPGGYGDLAREIRTLGLLDRRPWFYAGVFAVLLLTGVLVVTAMVRWQHSWALLLAPVLAVVSTQIGFLGHDPGTARSPAAARRSRLLGPGVRQPAERAQLRLVGAQAQRAPRPSQRPRHRSGRARGCAGLRRRPGRDRRGLTGWVTRHQAWLFFPMLTLEAVTSTSRASARCSDPALRAPASEGAAGRALRRVRRPPGHDADLAAGAGLRGDPPGAARALPRPVVRAGAQGHAGADAGAGRGPAAAPGADLAQLRGGWFVDSALGGLNYQIEHHLFPSMPRPNLRRAQPVVRSFCEQHGVSYPETSALRRTPQGCGTCTASAPSCARDGSAAR